MFFIGVFGVQDKSETIKTEQAVTCPVCGAYDRFEVIRVFSTPFLLSLCGNGTSFFVRTRCR